MFRTVITLFLLQPVALVLFGQHNECVLSLSKGQEIFVNVDVVNNKIQTAGAQVINFRLVGSAFHKFTITDITNTGFKIRQKIQQIQFEFDGMGQKKKFDSNNEEDLGGPFGPFMKELLANNHEFVIDKYGFVRSGFKWNWKTSITTSDDKNVAIIDMLTPLLDITNSSPSGPELFRIINLEDSLWIAGMSSKEQQYDYLLKLAAFTDSTIQMHLKTTGSCNSSLETMGRQTNTIEKIVSDGNIIIDRKTCLMKERTVTTDSNGTTEVMGGKLPINGKIKVTMVVNPEK